MMISGKQHIHHYPYGELWRPPSGSSANAFLFEGKERLTADGIREWDYDARRYCSMHVPFFTTPDPLAEKTPWLSPYVFCAANPVMNIDPTGMEVWADAWCQQGLIDGLTKDEQEYVKFDKYGHLDKDLINSCESSSENFNFLKELANSTMNYRLCGAADFKIDGKTIELVGEGEDGTLGQTLMPNIERAQSPDKDVHIYTSYKLEPAKRASNIAHELYGHALFFNRGLDPLHTYDEINIDFDHPQYDEEYGMMVYLFVPIKTNVKLEEHIKIVERNALKNYKNNYK